jgi:hypothetical protein
MKSKRIRVEDLVNYNKITNFGPGRVVKIIQMRTEINNFKYPIASFYGVELPEPFVDGCSCEYSGKCGDLILGTSGRENGCVWALFEELELLTNKE